MFLLLEVIASLVIICSELTKEIPALIIFTNLLISRYRRKRDKLVEKVASAPIPTMWGPFKANCYKSTLDGTEHIAMVKVSKSQLEYSIVESVFYFPLFPSSSMRYNFCHTLLFEGRFL